MGALRFGQTNSNAAPESPDVERHQRGQGTSLHHDRRSAPAAAPRESEQPQENARDRSRRLGRLPRYDDVAGVAMGFGKYRSREDSIRIDSDRTLPDGLARFCMRRLGQRSRGPLTEG